MNPLIGGIDPAKHEAMVGDAFLNKGDFANARRHYANAIEYEPTNALYHWHLGVCDDKLGQGYRAVDSFQTAARLDPQFAFAHASLGSWFLNNGIIESALPASAKALELAPGNHSIMQLRARVLEVAGELENSWQLTQELIAAKYLAPATLMLFSRHAIRHQEQNRAISLLENRLKAGGLSTMDASGLHMSLAALLDSIGQYDAAFSHAKTGNDLRRPAYNSASHEHTFDQLISYFTREKLSHLPKAIDRTPLPVFIVGMPRSGTSLVEQILASHPQIHGGGELDFMYEIWAGTIGMIKAQPNDYPQCLDRLTLDQIDGISQIYLQPLAAMNPSATRITDKLPLNLLHLGLIAIFFPGARVIHCRRDPMDTCLSCYLTSFGFGHEFKYTLPTLGHFYNQYDRLMNHWKSELDLPILDVQYEDVIADTPAQARRMIDFLSLPWDPSVLQFQQVSRPVATASLQQVRRPIYRSSVQRWRNYEKHLGELKRLLSSVPSSGTPGEG